jgi:uncharacterized protein
MWQPGERIVLRSWRSGQLTWAAPVIVVADAPDCIALYLPVNTPIKLAVHLDGSPIPRDIPYEERHALAWRIGDGIWHSEHRLLLTRPGSAHAFSLFWGGADWSFHGWYVDLLRPLTRTPLGFDTEDQVLDIVVAPDCSWQWKDEDEFASAQRVGRFTADEATAIRAEGERVIAAIEARAWPLDTGWEHWRPDPAWEKPRLPEGWDAR